MAAFRCEIPVANYTIAGTVVLLRRRLMADLILSCIIQVF